MKGAMWIALVLVAVGLILYAFEVRYRRKKKEEGIEEEQGGLVGRESASESDLQSELESGAESDSESEPESKSDSESEECCGLHLVCEKDSLSPMSDEVVYYDDEELDRFVGRDADSYSEEEVEEFRDVLMTLLPGDVAGWARSITLRRLELPPEVRDELLILVNEQRSSHK